MARLIVDRKRNRAVRRYSDAERSGLWRAEENPTKSLDGRRSGYIYGKQQKIILPETPDGRSVLLLTAQCDTATVRTQRRYACSKTDGLQHRMPR